MADIEESAPELTAREGQSGQQAQRGIKELQNRKRGLEIKRCNLSAGRAEPAHAGEEDEVRSAIVELQAVICEIELASG